MASNTTPQRPMVVVVNEARQTLITTLNRYLRDEQIPCFILEPIVKELYTELKLNADRELEQGYQLMQQPQTKQDIKGEE
jgi:hypothetical protein